MAWERRGYCYDCDRKVLGKYIWPEYLRDGILCTLTCGLYLPIALWRASRRRWACPRCGEVIRV